MLYRRLVVLAAVSVSVVTLGSGIARADDMGYLRQLDAVNIPSDSPYEVLTMGHSVCAAFASGRSSSSIEQAIMAKGRATDEPGWSKSQADWLIAAAVVNLCPQIQEAPSSPQP
jgi:Protein of unknown function (DUF732)